MSALSPVTTFAVIGAPVSGLVARSVRAWVIAASTCTVIGSCGWNADAHAEWSVTISGSIRPGDCASMTCMSERCPRYASDRRVAARPPPGARRSTSSRGTYASPGPATRVR